MIKYLSERKQPPLASISFSHFIIFLFITSCWKCSVCLTSAVPLLSITWQCTAFCFPSSALHWNSYWQGHKWLANNQISGPTSLLNSFSLFPLVSVDTNFLLSSFVAWPLCHELFLYNSQIVSAQSFCFLFCLFSWVPLMVFPILLNLSQSNFSIHPHINYKYFPRFVAIPRMALSSNIFVSKLYSCLCDMDLYLGLWIL